MNKLGISAFLFFFLTSTTLHAADKVRSFRAAGEVVTVDPVYAQLTIEHGPIKGFAQDGQTEFYVSSPELLKDIARGDLVEFEFADTKGDVKIDKIAKTGTAAPKEEGVPFGDALQQTLTQPVGEAVEGGEGALSTPDLRIKDGEVKQKIATF